MKDEKTTASRIFYAKYRQTGKITNRQIEKPMLGFIDLDKNRFHLRWERFLMLFCVKVAYPTNFSPRETKIVKRNIRVNSTNSGCLLNIRKWPTNT